MPQMRLPLQAAAELRHAALDLGVSPKELLDRAVLQQDPEALRTLRRYYWPQDWTGTPRSLVSVSEQTAQQLRQRGGTVGRPSPKHGLVELLNRLVTEHHND